MANTEPINSFSAIRFRSTMKAIMKHIHLLSTLSLVVGLAAAFLPRATRGHDEESIDRRTHLIATHNAQARQTDFTARREQLRGLAELTAGYEREPLRMQQFSQATSIDQLRRCAEPWTLLRIHINPESRVKLAVVSPPVSLTVGDKSRFLLEVFNEAGIEAPLRIRAIDRSQPGTVDAPWCSVEILETGHTSVALTGEQREWKLVEICCKEVGFREIHFSADAGQGTQDLGFRATADLLIKCLPRTQAP